MKLNVTHRRIRFRAGALSIIMAASALLIGGVPAQGAEETATLKDFVWDIPQTFFFTITNPGAVLGLVAIFGGVSTFVEVKGYIDSFVMVAAIMGGSLAWWIFLSNMIGRVRHRITLERFKMINQVAGALLAGFGIILVAEMVIKNRLLF